jgi:hypothetical protein
MGDCPDVVVVGMSNNRPADILFLRDEIADIRDDVVDARHVLLRKLEAHVDDDDVIPIFDNGHVSSDFLASSYGDNAECRSSRRVSS